MLERWNEQLGIDALRMEAIEQAMQRPSDRAIRVRYDRPNIALPWPTEPIPWYAQGRWLVDPLQRPSQSPHYVCNDYYIQDAGSLLALALLAPKPHERICDLCAAPGGKASGILEKLGTGGFLLANEPIRSRWEILEWSLNRIGNPRFALSGCDPDRLPTQLFGTFDAVLVDAPCSGQTLVGKGKRSDNAFDASQVAHSAARQRRILTHALPLLKPGGRLVYSTCTFAVEENESQMEWLDQAYPECWKPIQPPELANWQSPGMEGCYRLWPDRDRCAGSFAAGRILVNPLPEDPDLRRKDRRSSSSKGSDALSSPRGVQDSMRDVGKINDLFIGRWGNTLHGIAVELEEIAGIEGIRLPMLGSYSGKNFIPDHLLALLDGNCLEAERGLELDDEQTMRYARGEPLPLGGSQVGWAVAKWKGTPLGWLKQIGSRCNNYFPKIGRLS